MSSFEESPAYKASARAKALIDSKRNSSKPYTDEENWLMLNVFSVAGQLLEGMPPMKNTYQLPYLKELAPDLREVFRKDNEFILEMVKMTFMMIGQYDSLQAKDHQRYSSRLPDIFAIVYDLKVES